MAEFSKEQGLTSHQPPILPLTGLRFVAAIFVCVAHTTTYLVPQFSYNVERIAAEGMTLFFVLSGFVIHYNYSNAILRNPLPGLYQFFVSRFARLYPLFFVCLLLDLIKNHGYSTLPPDINTALPYYLTLTQSWIYKPLGAHSLIYQFGLMPSVAWSISTEWFFYVAYPLVCFGLFKAKSIGHKLFLMLLLVLVTITLISAMHYSGDKIARYGVQLYGNIAGAGQDSFFRWIIYFSPYSRISEFLLGCLTAAIYMQLREHAPSKKETLIGVFVLYLTISLIIPLHHYIFNPPAFFPLSSMQTFHQCFGFAPPVAIIIFCAARYQSRVSDFLSSKVLLLGGEISYSIYLLHLPIAEAFSRDAAPAVNHSILLADMSRLPIAMYAILGAAYLSYLTIEMPARNFLRKHLALKPRMVLKPAEE